MRFALETAQIFVPDSLPAEEALARTTHLAVGAHPDDLEIMACHGILACFQSEEHWFSGVVMTDGSGSARIGPYADYTDQEMQEVRRKEQKKAAMVGGYAAQVLLDYPSSAVKDGSNAAPMEDLRRVLQQALPEVVYTHNLADKHDTHVATALRAIEAIRGLPPSVRPRRLYGCEVWRDLDWLADQAKVALDVSGHENLQRALLGLFDSQICGGKRYDLATMGRRRANATYYASHEVDESTAVTYAMDLTHLIEDPAADVNDYVQWYIAELAEDVADRIDRLA